MLILFVTQVDVAASKPEFSELFDGSKVLCKADCAIALFEPGLPRSAFDGLCSLETLNPKPKPESAAEWLWANHACCG